MIKYIINLILILIFVVGCNGNQSKQNSEEQQMNTQPLATNQKFDQNISDKVNKTLKEKQEVTDVISINSDKKLLVAVEIQHKERLRLKKIEKKLKKQLKEQYPEKEITLSLDKKIFLETKKLKQKVINDEVNRAKLEKELKKIIDLSKEKT